MKKVTLAGALALALVVALLAFTTAGCDESGNNPDGTGTEDAQDTEGQNGDDQAGREDQNEPVTLTLYFMGSTPASFFLSREARTIPNTQAVARAAMEELIKGPAEGSSLQAVLPDTVKVLDVSIADGVCTVDLSKEILTDKASQGGAGAEVEALALDSIANTLTEYPTIRKVKLLFEGKQSGEVDGYHIEDFWGHVGLPEYLERDMSHVQ